MVQIFDLTPTESSRSLAGKSMAMGIAKNFPDPQQLVQRGMLQEAMNRLPQNASPLDMLKTIGPQLMTTPGGAQLLGELAPLLQRTGGNKALSSYYEDKMAELQKQIGQQQQIGAPQQPGAPTSQQTTPYISPNIGTKVQGQQYFSKPTAPVSPESTFPKISALPEKKPMMSPEQKDFRRLQLMKAYADQNIPYDPAAIDNVIQNEENSIMNYNAQIDKENEARAIKQQKQTADIMKRFEQSSQVPKSNEDKFIFEKFANEAKDAANPNDQYTYAKKKYEQYDNARNGLLREADLPGIGEKLFRKAIGTYKSKEDVLKQLRPNIQKLLDLGLENEARSILSNEIGLGMEDTELALFPPSAEESKLYSTFKPNPQIVSYQKQGKGKDIPRFPGEELSLNEDQFQSFKQDILGILEKYPNTNLVALRGVVNQDKKYSWTDYGKALAELIDEGLIDPNNYQEQQWNVVKSPPIPGLGAMFKEFWMGTK